MAAYELVRNGIAVVMLETGEYIQRGTLIRVAGKNLYRNLPPMTKPTGFVVTGDPQTILQMNYALGGLSNQWNGAVPRFCADDFTAGGRIHEKYCWPVTYGDLAPYYEIVERTMEITADRRDVPNLPAGYCDYQQELPRDWQPVERAAMKRGQGFTTMPLADGPPFLFLRRGTSFNSYSKLLARLSQESAFKLITRAHALRLEWDGQNKKVIAATYCDKQTMAEHRVRGSAFAMTIRTEWAMAPACSASISMITRASGGPLTWKLRSLHCRPLLI
jgi:choline dehydrogenase-like flavoprotein